MASNRVEVQKRNDVYDQKFLFKKNFISKYQPGPTMGASNKATPNQYNKMTPNNYIPHQNNDALYKGVNDNYQTGGMGNQIFNSPNYQINRKGQGVNSGQSRGYIDNQRSVDGTQRTAQTEQKPSTNLPYQHNNTQGTTLRFADMHQEINQQNLPEITDTQYQTPPKHPMFARTKPTKANSAKVARNDLLESVDRLNDSKPMEYGTASRRATDISAIVNGSMGHESPQSLNRATRSPITGSNMPV